MTAKEILEDLIESIAARLKELSVILEQTNDNATRTALAENHRKSIEQLQESKKRLKEL